MHTKENTENAEQKMQADTAPEKAPVEAGEQAPVDDEGKAAVPKKKRSRAGKKGEGKASARPGPRPMRRLEEDVIRKRRVEFKRRLAKHQRLSANAEKLIGKYEHELQCRGLALDADADNMQTEAAGGEAPAADAQAAAETK